MRSRIRFAAVAALGLGTALSLAGTAKAEEPGKTSGTIMVRTVETHEINLTADGSQAAFVNRAVGANNQGTDRHGLYTGVSYGQRTGATGSYSGFNTSTFPNGTESVSYKGTFTIAMTDGKPSGVNHQGTWEYTGGTGAFGHVHGGGTYTLHEDLTGLGVVNYTGTETGVE